MSPKVTRKDFVQASTGLVAGLASGASVFSHVTPAQAAHVTITAPTEPKLPQVTVRYSQALAIDHTEGTIGIHKGWLRDVGITILPKPYGTFVPSDQLVLILSSGHIDIQTGSAAFNIPGCTTNKNYVAFGYGDLFQGFIITGQPQAGYKSFSDLVKAGMSPDKAAKIAVGQLKGKRLVIIADTGALSFLTFALQKAGLSASDLTITRNGSDSPSIAAMLAHRADFMVGTAPGNVTMLQKGFKQIYSARDLVTGAKPSANSLELNAVFHDGWAATPHYFKNNRDTCFRFMSAMYRTLGFLKKNPTEALTIQVPYYNSISGLNLTMAQGKIIYNVLDPFYTFEEQASVFYSPSSPLYPEYVYGAHLKFYEQKGVLRPGGCALSDIDQSIPFYREFQHRQASSRTAIRAAENAIRQAKSTGKSVAKATELLTRARQFFEWYDYLDAETWARAAQRFAQA